MLKKIMGLTLSITALLFVFNIGNSANAYWPEELEKEIAEFDLNSYEKQEKTVILSDNTVATIGLEPMYNPLARVSNGTYKAYWYTGSANASFKFDVKSNKITRVYDKYHLMIGVSVKSNKLKLDNSKQATYYFEFGTPIWNFGGWNGWLRAKINNKNQLVYSIK